MLDPDPDTHTAQTQTQTNPLGLEQGWLENPPEQHLENQTLKSSNKARIMKLFKVC